MKNSRIGRPPGRPNNSQLETIEKLMQKERVQTINELIEKTGFDHEAVRNIANYLARQKGYELMKTKSHVLVYWNTIKESRT